LTYRLFVNGEQVWDTVITAPPVSAEAKSSSFWDKIRGV
jgi:alkaline phosphatase D